METEPEQEPLASSPPAKSAAYILKVVASQMSPESPDGVEKTTELVSGSEEVLFDSSAGDSDSYSDAHRKFVEAWWALSSSPEKKETTVLQLFVMPRSLPKRPQRPRAHRELTTCSAR